MTLSVTILKGCDLHDTSIITVQHVYVQVRIGMEVQRTEHRYGVNPHFGDALFFAGPLQAQQMEVELWANHLTGARMVGRGMLSLVGVEVMGMQSTHIKLFEQNGKQKGTLEVCIAIGGGMPGMMVGGPQMMMGQQQRY